MYKLFFIVFIGFLSAQQPCKLSFSNSSLSKEGKVIFTIKNNGNKKEKTPKQYPIDFANVIDIQVYNEDRGNYGNSGYNISNATCLKVKDCFGKMLCLKNCC